MYVIVIDYLAELAQIDEALDSHVSWLEEQYNAGLFLASGRQEPRTGGLIFATGSRSDIEAAISNDPFATLGLARHTMIEFHPSKFGGALASDEVRQALA
ncbi:hypothetical protein G7068_02215 [Leucobacter viscericola]|uniref:YCII-related domain-containing protein n=1 Tax=Leucobacter viscericola TaxID=2714935 RepID=A0A6G7XCF1_9MICO|nr:YciI family protein [Leucobacter viscericola]QIK62146.1 hypothetical protein G7068_02215 [Leucobacter viscericola]